MKSQTFPLLQPQARLPSSLGLACNGSFDMYVCWYYTAANTTAQVSCPWYLPWYRQGEALPAPLIPDSTLT